MADIPARTEMPAGGAGFGRQAAMKVTTRPDPGLSRKVHVGDVRVAMREIDLEPSSGEPALRVYDTSGPYTDPQARIDIMAGLPIAPP